MTDLDPEISVMLDRLVRDPQEAGEWERVLVDAGAIKQPRPRRRRSPRLVLVLAALAALATALAFVPALAGQGYFWFLDHAPKPTTPVVTVTSFTDRSGTTWQLTAYRDDRGLCVQLTNGTGGGASGCASDLPLNAGVYGSGASQRTFVYGPVTTEAQSVEISGSGEQVEATVTTAPEALQTDIKFYIAQLPEGMPGTPLTVKALDGQGHTVATLAVPGRSTP
jgi:hypothetical protein